MNWFGILIGVISFFVIGIFHPVVIKCEYYFSDRIWPLFLAGGLVLCIVSLFIKNDLASGTLAVFGFSMLWSILELKHQTERVKKGWFPENPKRKAQNARREIRPEAKAGEDAGGC